MSDINNFREGAALPRMPNHRRAGWLFSKTRRILIAYEQAANCSVSIVDLHSKSDDDVAYEQKLPFCSLCKKLRWDTGTGEEHPCVLMHRKGIEESCRLGGSYIYMCELGFVFWTSPLYTGGRYAGALIAGNCLGIGREEAALRIQEFYGNRLSGEQIREQLAQIPEKTFDETKALAQMMLICARQISGAGTGQDPEKITPIAASRQETPELSPAADNAPGIPEAERRLLAALRRGDSVAAKKNLNTILEIFSNMSSGDFEFFQFRAIELVVFLSRASIPGGNPGDDTVLEANNRYLKRIAESANLEDLTERLRVIIDRMAGKIFSFQGIRHASALRKAEGFIRENYTRKLSLEEIAGVSGLSAPYFSTIFREEMGENLSTYLNRLRVEKAAGMLTESKIPLTKIAEACGFEDQSWFSKIFKNYMGVSPGRYREQGGTSPEHYTRYTPEVSRIT
jgi:AraC-like DNA-binding protein/ligand-binding sensor protein